MFLPHPEKGTHFFYCLSGFGLKPTAKPQGGGSRSHEISNQPLQLSLGIHTPISVPDSELQDTNCSWFFYAFLTQAQDTHHALLWGLGLGPTPTGGRSPVQGLLEIHSGRFSLPLQKLRAAWWERPPRQSPDPAFPKRQSPQQGVTSPCKLPGAAPGGDL